MVLDYFMDISMSDVFLELDVQSLTSLLSDDKIHVYSEKDVFHAVMRWVKYDIENRRKSLGTLLACVRFKFDALMLISRNFIHQLFNANHPKPETRFIDLQISDFTLFLN